VVDFRTKGASSLFDRDVGSVCTYDTMLRGRWKVKRGMWVWNSELCVTIISWVKDAKCVNKYGILVIAVC
jgi:hypothetical protein